MVDAGLDGRDGGRDDGLALVEVTSDRVHGSLGFIDLFADRIDLCLQARLLAVVARVVALVLQVVLLLFQLLEVLSFLLESFVQRSRRALIADDRLAARRTTRASLRPAITCLG